MTAPANIPSGSSSAVPAYRKWYFGAGGSPGTQGMRAVAESAPLSFEAIRIHEERKEGPPSTPADGYSAQGTFTIPEGTDGKKLYGTCSFFLGVDDRGSLEVKDSNGYLAGSSLLSSHAMPDGIVRELSYEQRRDLISGINCRLGETVLVSHNQSFDALGRPVTRTQRRGTEPARSDSFSYNGRNELTGATLGGYGYDKTSATARRHGSRPRNSPTRPTTSTKYTGIEENAEAPFAPQYDASGNQPLIRTSTGI